ncbi:MAG: glycosyl hydrolase, partial [Gemmatimonadota bacterium]|nr:glycosyl hydrolase [Gemmatimonadota bacterium]
CRPWTYWWWMGSAVEKEEITRHLLAYREAGLGGVHIIPIYGAQGSEESYIPFLSPEWIEMLSYTVEQSGFLDMGVDMTCGTGWPFGGERIKRSEAAGMLIFKTYDLKGGHFLNMPLLCWDEEHGKGAPLQAVVAYAEDGRVLDITSKIDGKGKLRWLARKGVWKVYAIFRGWTNQQVKRAAPGGEGNVLDYFSRSSLNSYLDRFDDAMADLTRNHLPRSFYHDSYEVYGANWTDEILGEFIERRGYDLCLHIPALLGDALSEDEEARVRCDYRETISDLLLENFTKPWVDWCHYRGSITRNQAHGSPGNLLDLYAAADIPETEAFGSSGFDIPGLRIEKNMPKRFGRPELIASLFASSAAHLRGRRLVSAESCTWLGEHFKVALSQVKPEIDKLFLSGINHIFYHGMTYSPAIEPWPGWLFYASTNFGMTGAFWEALPELNAYITRCQSFLQSGKPDNDVLLYFPIHDLWSRGEGENMLHSLCVHNTESWLKGTPFFHAARAMRETGYTFDYISDRLLEEITADTEGLYTRSGQAYRLLLVPACEYMPPGTLERIVRLASKGATVVFQGRLPSDVPGLGNLEERRLKLGKLLGAIKPAATETPGIKQAVFDRGRFLVGDSLDKLLEYAGVPREPAVDHGLELVRRREENRGHVYFLANLGRKGMDGWVTLGKKAGSAVVFDPLRGGSGLARTREKEPGVIEVYIQLQPGESTILRTTPDRLPDTDRRWRYLEQAGEPVEITGDWEVTFTRGGPSIPEGFTTGSLASWTEDIVNKNDSLVSWIDSTGAARDSLVSGTDSVRTGAVEFAGTAKYSISFRKPGNRGTAGRWLLDLGRVHESARVWLNGQYLSALWCHPYRISLPEEVFRTGENKLEVEVTNLAANRIAGLDRRKVEWRKFHDINFVNIRYEPFDASSWELEPSGLLGPVRLVPVKD